MRNINFLGLTNLCPSSPLIDVPQDFVNQTELHKVCELVFAVDDRTKLPTGDLNVLFSDSVPQDIRDWVIRNLQSPCDVGGISSVVNGKQVDDDIILSCVRERNESQIDYINRIDTILKDIYSNSKEGN